MNTIISRQFISCVCALLLVLIISCKQGNKTDRLTSLKDIKINENKIKIKWSDSLIVYNPLNLIVEPNNQLTPQSKFKIYVYLNLACSSCLAELNEWSKLSNLFKEKNIELRMICYAKDNFEYFKYLYESKEINQIPFPFFLEYNFDFSRLNKMFKKYEMNQIALTDNEDNILLFGDIIHSKDIYNSFINIINK